MWGTIAKMRVKPGAEAFLMGQFAAMSTARMAGWMSTHIYRLDSDPHEYWMVAMFESKEAYRKNAESKAQHSWYMTLRSALEADPEWHDVAQMAEQHAR